MKHLLLAAVLFSSATTTFAQDDGSPDAADPAGYGEPRYRTIYVKDADDDKSDDIDFTSPGPLGVGLILGGLMFVCSLVMFHMKAVKHLEKAISKETLEVVGYAVSGCMGVAGFLTGAYNFTLFLVLFSILFSAIAILFVVELGGEKVVGVQTKVNKEKARVVEDQLRLLDVAKKKILPYPGETTIEFGQRQRIQSEFDTNDIRHEDIADGDEL